MNLEPDDSLVCVWDVGILPRYQRWSFQSTQRICRHSFEGTLDSTLQVPFYFLGCFTLYMICKVRRKGPFLPCEQGGGTTLG